MSDQNNTSFAHAFLPGLILGLIIGAVAGAFVPDMMSGTKIKVDPAHSGGATHERDSREPLDQNAQDIINQAEEGLDDAEETAGDVIDDAKETAEELIDDAESDLPSSP
jgi:gas vesicle protein